MSYEQALKHSKNHRKDRFYQQCSGYFGDGVSHQMGEEQIKTFQEKCSRIILEKGKTSNFPVYVHYNFQGALELCSRKDLGSVQVDSYEDLVQIAKEC